jgi:hypothetical protein
LLVDIIDRVKESRSKQQMKESYGGHSMLFLIGINFVALFAVSSLNDSDRRVVAGCDPPIIVHRCVLV